MYRAHRRFIGPGSHPRISECTNKYCNRHHDRLKAEYLPLYQLVERWQGSHNVSTLILAQPLQAVLQRGQAYTMIDEIAKEVKLKP